LPYGGWSDLWRSDRVPFSKRQGEKLRRIGEVLGPLLAHVCAQLPCGSSSLYELARLGRATVEDLVRRHIVHPQLRSKEVIALVREILGQRKSPSKRLNLRQRLERLANFVADTLAQWTPEQRQFATTELDQLIRRIKGGSTARVALDNSATRHPRNASSLLAPVTH
jgi:hypothetical protein